MGKLFLSYMEGYNIYTCRHCGTHLGKYSQLISKAFRGKSGKAYLYLDVMNVIYGQSEARTLLTGKHIVCDIYCSNCKTYVGWKYDLAQEDSQKYKEGKYILERAYLDKIYWNLG